MRKRLVTQKYLRDLIKYNLKVFVSDEKDYYVAVKELIEIEAPFILSNGLLLMDSGYFIVETFGNLQFFRDTIQCHQIPNFFCEHQHKFSYIIYPNLPDNGLAY